MVRSVRIRDGHQLVEDDIFRGAAGQGAILFIAGVVGSKHDHGHPRAGQKSGILKPGRGRKPRRSCVDGVVRVLRLEHQWSVGGNFIGLARQEAAQRLTPSAAVSPLVSGDEVMDFGLCFLNGLSGQEAAGQGDDAPSRHEVRLFASRNGADVEHWRGQQGVRSASACGTKVSVKAWMTRAA
jgi:hypothetical protein